ncbi:MAG: ribosome biogenesis GTPase YlqF [Clostridia bacterium]|nr:ribosome biogenesis GTPase YlqF [Clostridia bacterium]
MQQSKQIQWFPGHMAKTKRLIRESLSLVDIVIEILDARIPYSSHNPDIEKIAESKPKLILLNKASLASPDICSKWREHYKKKGIECLFTDCNTGEGLGDIMPKINSILAEKLARYSDRGMLGRTLKALVVGIPNSGKSTFINRMAGSAKAKAENRPGVTKDKQWVSTKHGLDLLDTPGVLWPKFEERLVGENLAITGAIKDMILDQEEIACLLISRLRRIAPEALISRYKLTEEELSEELIDFDVLEAIGRKRGFLAARGEINTERTAITLLEEFRSGKIGRVSLETP